MITRSLSRLSAGERQGSVVGLRHKDVFLCSGTARRPGPWTGHVASLWEQAERAIAASNYWSSTPNATNASNAWNVNFNNGNVNTNNKTFDRRVRAVRGGS